ncbi:Ku protein [Streptomyces sp. NPDC006739]|uniref:non-homologous end joining protein Ku n=1 Tax=Streptomyces sp. NPDC006739 TaxID=3364763 RepID=UPI0036CF8F17
MAERGLDHRPAGRGLRRAKSLSRRTPSSARAALIPARPLTAPVADLPAWAVSAVSLRPARGHHVVSPRSAQIRGFRTAWRCFPARTTEPLATDEDLGNLPLPTAKAIEIDAFVAMEDIDPIRMGAGYYLAPGQQVAAKPYKLLVEALRRSSRVAIAKYAWSGRERLGMLRVRGDALLLQELLWPDEIRDPTELLPSPTEVSEDEIEGALALMDSMTVDALEGEEFTDRYTEAIAQIIEAKRDQKPLPEAPEPEQPAQVLDLMAALNESVQKAKASRTASAGPAQVHELPEPNMKAAAKKTAAKKTATKKTTGHRPRSA